LYLSHTIPHPPLTLPARCRTAGRPIYHDAIEHLDEQTGVLLDALDRLGLADNTLVMFTSDNGPMAKDGDAGGLRGRIRSSYEGGVRVPFIARWPGHIPAGREAKTPVIAYDFFPTLLRLAGGTLPADREFDGQDVWPVFTGKGDFAREKPFVWVYDDNVTAVRDGRWKFHVGDYHRPLKKPELYDIEADPKESRNLAAEHPRVAQRLAKFIRTYQKQIPKVWTVKYPVRDPRKAKGGIRRE
ncbi:sulfatase-like hydrolase/transferase, partial [bacterium]|nr:sulfatase-like hydrolase/transferase [bacterium]